VQAYVDQPAGVNYRNKDLFEGKHQGSYSGLLRTVLQGDYRKFGFDRLGDEIFEALCIARIVEPTSKLDSPLGLVNLGVDPSTATGSIDVW
jgi:hypothetical protein